ncbi:MAG: hypothetical protein JNL76_05635 [Alphaproteobacteria bacterium]|nr:hypothetical protein [Alphaproteobacteria bacterium]
MKKPNKLYKNLRQNKSSLAAAFAVSRRPVRSLKSLFRDVFARDVAEHFNLEPSRYSYQIVMATLARWKKKYHGPSLEQMFKFLTPVSYKKDINPPKPEIK